jgi:glycine/D-amino acid oxidase-like deaminating enzyme
MARLAARGVRGVPGEVEAIEISDDRVTGVRLASGEIQPREVIVIGPRFESHASYSTLSA